MIEWNMYDLTSKTVNYQGHVIDPGELVGLKHAIDTTCILKVPTNVTELWSFLRLCTSSDALGLAPHESWHW